MPNPLVESQCLPFSRRKNNVTWNRRPIQIEKDRVFLVTRKKKNFGPLISNPLKMIHSMKSPSSVRSPIKFLQNPISSGFYSQQHRDFIEVQTIMNMFLLEILLLPSNPSDPSFPYFILISSSEEEKLLVSSLLSRAKHHHSLLKTRLILEQLAIDMSSSTSSPPTCFPNTTYSLATIRVWIVYCEEDGTPHLFEGKLEGHFAFPSSFSSCFSSTPRAFLPSLSPSASSLSPLCLPSLSPPLSSCFLNNWETLFFPLGFGGDRSLSHLSSSRFVISFKTQPYTQLASMLLGNLYKHARFESHITVLLSSPSSASPSSTSASCASPPSYPSTPVPSSPLDLSDFSTSSSSSFSSPFSIRDQIENFKKTCGELKCKPIFIELETGQVPNQLMTGKWHVGSFSDVLNQVYILAKVSIHLLSSLPFLQFLLFFTPFLPSHQSPLLTRT
jgi:hypothetical protein